MVAERRKDLLWIRNEGWGTLRGYVGNCGAQHIHFVVTKGEVEQSGLFAREGSIVGNIMLGRGLEIEIVRYYDYNEINCNLQIDIAIYIFLDVLLADWLSYQKNFLQSHLFIYLSHPSTDILIISDFNFN